MGADWPQLLRIASEVYHSRRKAYPNHIIFTTVADWPKFLQIASKEPTYTNTAPVLIKELERQTYLEAINQQDKWNKLVDQYYSNSFTTKCSGPFIIPLLLGINNLPLCIEFQNFLTKMHKRVTETPGHERFKVEGYNNFVEKFSHALLNNMQRGSQASFDGELLPLSAFILHASLNLDQLEEINQRHKNTVMGQLLWILAELVKNARTRTLRNDESWTELDKRYDGEQWNVRYKTTIGSTFVDISEYYRQYKAQGILDMMDSFNNSKPCS
ncbi:hypothetical protein QL093DRAFT_2518797 [Fusarium oxysporum]|nr:hypothetical protein QL093DRAFT_2518797 [Fusarium oxysporum]